MANKLSKMRPRATVPNSPNIFMDNTKLSGNCPKGQAPFIY